MNRKLISAAALSILLFFPAASSWASSPERTYTITESELEALESNLDRHKKLAAEQKAESGKLRKALDESETASGELRKQLDGSKTEIEVQKRLIEAANKSLEEYAKEEKKEKDKLRLQRDIGWGLAAGIFLYRLK